MGLLVQMGMCFSLTCYYNKLQAGSKGNSDARIGGESKVLGEAVAVKKVV